MPCWTMPPWQHNLNQMASDNPGAVKISKGNTTMKMAELEQRSGVGRETIRYYIREGLLKPPLRPHRNAAIYSEYHVKELLKIKSLQEDPDLTLGVIRRVLQDEAASQDVISKADLDTRLSEILRPSSDSFVPLQRLYFEDSRHAAVTEQFVQQGIITIHRTDETDYIDQLEADIVRTWVKGNTHGDFAEKFGFTANSITFYADLIDELVDKMQTHFLEKISGKMQRDAAAELAVKGLGGLTSLVSLLIVHSFRNRGAAKNRSSQPD
jgi:DNA-binding transcriptional MerR regulator